MNVQLIVVPYDSGYLNSRMGAGPQSILQNGLVSKLEKAGHSTLIERIESEQSFHPEIATAFHLNRRISRVVTQTVQQRRIPLLLSGNCNATLGLVSGLNSTDSLALFWFDAHGDFNTPETSLSGFLDGMALAMITGRCWRSLAETVPGFKPLFESNIVLAGARDIDPMEIELLKKSDVHWISPDHFEERFSNVVRSLRNRCNRAVVHLDLDVLDPKEAPANQYAAPNGLSIMQLINSIREIRNHFKIIGATFAAYDPSFDPDSTAAKAAIEAALAVFA